MIQLQNIKKRYPQFQLQCSLEVPPNRITALIGPNGSGKSTTFKAILGLIHPEEGQITMFGKPLSSLTAQDRAGIGVAMSHQARLLILDEPTTGLDVLAREEVLDILREYMLPGDRSILISSHISSDLEELCDDFYLIHEGKILLHEETDVLLDSYGILKVTEDQYKTIPKSNLLRKKPEPYGYRILTSHKQFFQENMQELTIEKCRIDEIILMMTKGEA